jgi:peptide/nickel transport system substrate-binding protein
VGADGVREMDGVRLSFEMDTTNGSYLMDKEIAQVAADSWANIGIEIKDLRVIDQAINAQLRANQGAGYRDLLNSTSGPDSTCQGDLLLVHKHSGSNRMSWVDDHFEEMFAAFRQEFDSSKWEDMCNEIQAHVAEQAPVVWFFTEPAFYGVSDRISFEPRNDGRLYLNMVLTGVK